MRQPSKHRRIWIIAVAFSVAPLLAACYRPAGESIAATPAALPIGSVLANSGSSDSALEIPATPQENLNSDTALVSPNELQVTVIGGTQPTLANQSVVTLAVTPMVTSTSQFITPGAPLALITPDTPNPMLVGTPSTATNMPSGLITPTSLPGADDECLYVVQPGDSLYLIAIRNDTTVDGLIAANPRLTGNPPIIYPGDQLVLSDCGDALIIPATATSAVPTIAPFTGATPTAGAGGQVYTVQPGDSLFVIAQRFGTTVDAIAQANSLSNPNVLQVGQQLIIPNS